MKIKPQYLFRGKFDLNKLNYYKSIVNKYLELDPDKIYIFISNNSKESISKRKLSKSNLQPIAELISKYDKNLFKNILDDIDNLTFNKLNSELNKVIKNTKDQILINTIKKLISNLKKKIFKSLTKKDGKYVSPSDIKTELNNVFNNDNIEIKIRYRSFADD